MALRPTKKIVLSVFKSPLLVEKVQGFPCCFGSENFNGKMRLVKVDQF